MGTRLAHTPRSRCHPQMGRRHRLARPPPHKPPPKQLGLTLHQLFLSFNPRRSCFLVLLVVPRVFRAPEGPGCFVCPWAAARPRAVRAASLRLGASPRSPARPRHRPLAPRQIPPAPFTPAALCRWSVLVCRLEARPGPVPRSVPYPQFRMQFPDTCSSSLSEKPGISTITFQSMKCAWGNCMRICADQAPPPLTGTAAWSLYSLWASWGSRVLSFWGARVCVVRNVINPRCFSCGFLPRCYERRQSEGFFAENGCFWA